LAQTIVAKAKAPLDEVRAGLEAELAQNADFLSKSAMRQLEARNKRELTAKTLEYLRRTMAIVRSWLRDGMMVASGSSHLVINYEVRETLEDLFAHADPAALAAVIEKSFASEQALSYNVSPETCIDTLLFDVREVLDGSRCAH
jgi:DNA polymerase-3 subunit delta'